MPSDAERHSDNQTRVRLPRRRFLRATAVGAPFTLAGCLGDDDPDDVTDDTGDADDDDDVPGDTPSDDGSGDDAIYGGELQWGGSVPVQSLDPHLESAAASSRVLENITEGLVRVNWEYELEPHLAESWTVSEDQTEIEFAIREGVEFHDGTELTSADVLASFERIRDGEMLAAGYFPFIESMSAPDEHTFSLQLTEPFTPLLSRMATSEMHIVPESQTDQSQIEVPIGTGPYEFESRELDAEFVMVRNDDYWRDEYPYMDRIVKTEIPDDESRLNSFEAGELDFVNDVPPRRVTEVEENPDVEYIERFPQSLVYLGLNCDEEPFDDLDARLALDYAIDKEDVVEAALYGNGLTTASPAPPGSEWVHPDVDPRPRDVDRAREHLEAAGYPDGFEASFKIPQPYADQVTAAEVIHSQALEVGIELNIEQITWSNWLSDVWTDRNFQATTSSYLALWYPDAAFHRFLHPDGAFFFTGWDDDEYNELIEDARQAFDIEQRADLYHEATEILQERRSGHLLLYWMPNMMARYPQFNGEIMSPDGSTFRFEDTWLDQ